jgi:N-acetyltransferase
LDFDLQPTLTGTLIEIRPLMVEDFDALLAAASDPLIWEQHPEKDRYKKEVFQRFFDGAIESGGAFAVIERGSGRIIGSSRYWNLKPSESEVEIGWTFIERAFWGGRYNGELKSLMLDHAFQFVDRVVFVVGENNDRSQKALRKIGAELVTTAERSAPDGSMRRNVIFAITRSRSAASRS